LRLRLAPGAALQWVSLGALFYLEEGFVAAPKIIPQSPRPALFAAALARDLAQIAGEIENECAALRINAERFHGLPRCIDIGGIQEIARDLGNASRNLDAQSRRLRLILDER
jgi:hypothetical protein